MSELAPASAPIRSRSWNRLIAIVVAILSCVGAPRVIAQHLDLDGPASPELGDTSVLVELGARATRERDEALAQAESATDPALAAGFRLRAAVRDLCGALAGLGVENPRFGSIGALDSLRMMDAMAVLDAMASEATDAVLAGQRAMREGNADAQAIAKWERSRAAVDALTRRCDALAKRIRESDATIATATDLDRAVAHALGELRPLVPNGEAVDPAWPPREPVAWEGSVESAALVVSGMAIDASLANAAVAAFDALRAGEPAPEVRRRRRATAWGIVDAIRAVDTLRKAQVTPTVSLGVSSACEAIATPNHRAVGEARIEEIGALGTLSEKVMDLEADGVNVIGLREAMGVLALGLGAPLDEKSIVDPRTIAIIRAMTEIVEEAQRAPRGAALDFRDGKFNRAWRALVRKHEEIEQGSFDLCARIARAPNVLGTPEAASAMASLSDSTMTLIRIASLSDWIAELRAGPNTNTTGPTRAGAADRLTVIRRGIGYDEHRDAALAELANWAKMRPVVLEMPAENRLRDGDPRLTGPTRSRGPALVRVMDLVRSEWISAWARADEIASIEATERVDLVRRLGAAIEQVGALHDDGLAARVSRWAGFRISPEALGEIRSRSEAVVGEAVSAAIDAQYARLGELLDEWDEACIGARAIAALGAVSEVRRDWPAEEGGAGVIAVLGGAPPEDAWLLDRRAELAAMSVWLAELDGATARDDRGMADAIVIWINHLAEPVLQEIHHRGTESTEK